MRPAAGLASDPTRAVELHWADHSSRLLLLIAVYLAAALAWSGISLLLAQPPDPSGLATTNAIAAALIAITPFLAPSSLLYRLVAAFCIVIFLLVLISDVLVSSTDLLGTTRYGVLDAVQFSGWFMLLVIFLVLRMRHPATIAAAVLIECLVGGTFFVNVVPWIRAEVAGSSYAEVLTVTDEAWTRLAMFGLNAVIIVVAGLVDPWVQRVLPVHGIAQDGDAVFAPHGDDRDRRLRYGLVTMLCCIDTVAIVLAHGVRRMTRFGWPDQRQAWWADVILSVSYSRLIMFTGIVTVALILVQGSGWRIA